MFYYLELDEECEDVFDKFPWVISERDELGMGAILVIYQWELRF